MRPTLKLALLCAALFVLSTGARRYFFADVKPIASTDAPQSIWALDAAVLLQTLENLAVMGFLILLVLAIAQWIGARRRPAA